MSDSFFLGGANTTVRSNNQWRKKHLGASRAHAASSNNHTNTREKQKHQKHSSKAIRQKKKKWEYEKSWNSNDSEKKGGGEADKDGDEEEKEDDGWDEKAAIAPSKKRAKTQIGAKTSQSPHIWESSLIADPPASNITPVINNIYASPDKERRRLAAIKTLRSTLTRLVSQHAPKGTKAPQLCFERWLARASLAVAPKGEAMKGKGFGGASVEEREGIIPSGENVDDGLVKDLTRNMPPDAGAD